MVSDEIIRDCQYLARVFRYYDEFAPNDIEMVVLTTRNAAARIEALTAERDAERARADRAEMLVKGQEDQLEIQGNELCHRAAHGHQLAARVAELEAAIDSIEAENGITSNGNMWRFWSNQAQELATKVDAERARAEAAEEELMAAQGQIADAQSAEARVAELEAALKTLHDLDAISVDVVNQLTDRVAELEVANAQLQSDLDLRNAQIEAVHEMAPAKPGLLHARIKELSKKKGPTDE